MKNSKIGSVVKYTLEKNIKNKWFIGLNILFLVITVVALNFNTVKDVKVAKQIKIDLDETDKEKAKILVQNMCEEILVNTVIEDYEILI